MHVSSSDDIPNWPRGWRLLVYVAALLVTVAVVVPVFIMGVGNIFGYDTCTRTGESTSIICSQTGRVFLLVVMLGIGLPLARAWSRFLVRRLATPAAPREPATQVPNVAPLLAAPRAVDLPGFQRLASGTIERRGSTAHAICLEGTELTFWSALALVTGRLRVGEHASIVFQRTPLRTFNLALAYWDPRSSTVCGVAGTAHRASALIAASCFFVFAFFRPPFAALCMALSGLFVASSCLYLMLMMRAKAALRNSLRAGPSPEN